MQGINFLPVINLCLQGRPTWNLIRRRLKEKRIGKIFIIWRSAKANISHPLEETLGESERGYKLCGGEVAALRTYSKIMRQDFLYQ